MRTGEVTKPPGDAGIQGDQLRILLLLLIIMIMIIINTHTIIMITIIMIIELGWGTDIEPPSKLKVRHVGQRP